MNAGEAPPYQKEGIRPGNEIHHASDTVAFSTPSLQTCQSQKFVLKSGASLNRVSSPDS
jgi:hypothetical protein